MDFYFGHVSGNSARSAFALFESGASFTPRPTDPVKGEARQPSYLALNPMGKVPALIDGDVRLWESNAINLYVAEQHPQARLIPESPAGRASMMRWLFFQAGHISPAVRPLLFGTNKRVQDFWKLKPTDPRDVEAGRAELRRYLPVLDEALRDREWLEDRFSLADIAYSSHLWLAT
ncbi:MAG TPA: glutathione S-transferase family protein, partial [Polyangia bacterium]|nr:glutathione S-transferase family protein [Polyangia bacterium]